MVLSFIERCPLFRVSFIDGSTVFTGSIHNIVASQVGIEALYYGHTCNGPGGKASDFYGRKLKRFIFSIVEVVKAVLPILKCSFTLCVHINKPLP